MKNTKLFYQNSYNTGLKIIHANRRLQIYLYKIQLVIHISTRPHPSSVYLAECHTFSCQNPNSEENMKKYADSITDMVNSCIIIINNLKHFWVQKTILVIFSKRQQDTKVYIHCWSKFWIPFKVFKRSILCSSRLYLFDWKYSTSSNIVKYSLPLKYLFYFNRLKCIHVVAKLNFQLP